jgi:hypothetical protein
VNLTKFSQESQRNSIEISGKFRVKILVIILVLRRFLGHHYLSITVYLGKCNTKRRIEDNCKSVLRKFCCLIANGEEAVLKTKLSEKPRFHLNFEKTLQFSKSIFFLKIENIFLGSFDSVTIVGGLHFGRERYL